MNSPRSWELEEIEPDVLKILKRMPRRDTEAIVKVMRLLPVDPYFWDIQKMKGTDNAWRRRVGAYRIFYKMKVPERILLVFHLERRTSKTY